MIRFLAGFEPSQVTGTTLQLRPGTAANSSGSEVIAKTDVTNINIAAVGALGRDTSAALAENEDWFVYLIKNDSTGALSAVLSKAISYGSVAVPSGYTMFRKLPFGFVYRSVWGGIPEFHCAHWPSPMISYTDFQSNGNFTALNQGAAKAWSPVSVGAFVPDNARFVWFEAEVFYGSSAGSAYLTESPGTELTGMFVGSSTPAATLRALRTVPHRINSARQIFYKVTGGARLSLRVRAYCMTEPS